ncbi:MAG: hypothetical protein KGL93_14445 [Gemmatimonadota bacterium]|nr:hypothetical protein [Gemmatimonadota bacterium]
MPESFSSEITVVVVNARIPTGDARRPWADAAALAGPRVVALGASADLRKRAPRGARVIDARGAHLRPDELAAYATGGSLPA